MAAKMPLPMALSVLYTVRVLPSRLTCSQALTQNLLVEVHNKQQSDHSIASKTIMAYITVTLTSKALLT